MSANGLVARATLALALLIAASPTAGGAILAPGDVLWSRVFAGGKHFNVPNSIGASPDGGTIFVTGSTRQGNHIDMETADYDASSGGLRWRATYDAPMHGPDAGVDLAVAPDGSKVYVAGTSWGGSTLDDYVVIAYDVVTGKRAWGARFNGPDGRYDYASAIAVSPDGSRVFVTGSATAGGHVEYGTLGYDAVTGHRLWTTLMPNSSNQGGAPADIVVAPDARTVFLTGKDFDDSTGFDYATVAYSAARGHQRWVARYNRSGLNGMDAATSVGVSPDGLRVYVTGTSDSSVTTIAYDVPAGVQSWVVDAAATLSIPPPRLVIAPDSSRVFVAYTSGDVETIAYDAGGGKAWSASYDGPSGGFDEGRAVTVNSSGSEVFVAGTAAAPGPAFGEYVALAYDAQSGDATWTSLWDGPAEGSDWPQGIVASPLGTSVFITGQTWSTFTEAAWGTVAFAA